MAKFRKKPGAVIEAEQWPGGSPLPDGCLYGSGEYFDLSYCFVKTHGGLVVRVDVGDWIITNEKGERAPYHPDIFAETYEVVDDSTCEGQTPVEKNLAEVKARLDAGTFPEFDPKAERIVIVPFDRVKIRLLTREGALLPSGVRRVFGFMFEVEEPSVDKLFVKRVHIRVVDVTFDYSLVCEFDLPDCLEVGIGGILQKTKPGHFLVEIVSRMEKVEEPSCGHRGGTP